MSTTPGGSPVLYGDLVRLRRAATSDAAVIWAVLGHPEVVRWWPGETPETCTTMVESGEQVVFVVELDDDPVGVIQYWEETDPDYRHAGIDVALHPDWHGRGLGTDAVRTMARHLLQDLGHHRVTIDPAAANARAIRCYEKVGFRRVGVMRSYERGGDGSWHDGLLMDLLPADLTTATGSAAP